MYMCVYTCIWIHVLTYIHKYIYETRWKIWSTITTYCSVGFSITTFCRWIKKNEYLWNPVLKPTPITPTEQRRGDVDHGVDLSNVSTHRTVDVDLSRLRCGEGTDPSYTEKWPGSLDPTVGLVGVHRRGTLEKYTEWNLRDSRTVDPAFPPIGFSCSTFYRTNIGSEYSVSVSYSKSDKRQSVSSQSTVGCNFLFPYLWSSVSHLLTSQCNILGDDTLYDDTDGKIFGFLDFPSIEPSLTSVKGSTDSTYGVYVCMFVYICLYVCLHTYIRI